MTSPLKEKRSTLSFPFRASVLFSAILLLAVFSGPGTTIAKPPGTPGGGGGGNGDPPLDGTIYFMQSGSGIWATSPDGSVQQLVSPEGGIPSNLVYGIDPQLDRWWLRIEESGELYDHTVNSNGATGADDYPHVELYAYHFGPGAPGGFARVRVTSLFGEIDLYRTDTIRWSNDGDDAYIALFGNDISAGFTIDPITGENTYDARYRSGLNIYMLPVSGPALDAAVRTGAWSPVAADDMFVLLEDMATAHYDLSPDGTAIVQRGGPGLEIVPFDPAVPPIPLVEGNASNPVWSRGPSGGQIAYAMSGKVFLVPADASSDPQVLLESKHYYDGFNLPVWSPDGANLVAHRAFLKPSFTEPQEHYLYVVPATGGRAQLITGDLPVVTYKEPFRWVSNALAP